MSKKAEFVTLLGQAKAAIDGKNKDGAVKAIDTLKFETQHAGLEPGAREELHKAQNSALQLVTTDSFEEAAKSLESLGGLIESTKFPGE